MKIKSLLSILFLFCSMLAYGHEIDNDLGKKVVFYFDDIQINKSPLKNLKGQKISIPQKDGTTVAFLLKENLLSGKSSLVQTYDGVSEDGKQVMKLSVFADKVEAFVSSGNGYWVFEPENIEENVYRIYDISEISHSSLHCSVDENAFEHFKETLEQVKLKSETAVTRFPIGDNLRVFRLAAASTGEMVSFYGSKDNVKAQIVSIIQAVNLIYEQELAISFSLIEPTMDGTIIFQNSSTDPFTPNSGFASAAASQSGFNKMNSQGILLYEQYDVGHTFHTLSGVSGAYSVRGEAGPSPCINGNKATGWTDWTMGSPLGAIVSVFAHEVGHQFTAWHTYNANGGTESNPTFCVDGWSNTHAVEPGGGSTMMAYGNNCQHPQNQSLTGENKLSYFHSKSIDAINYYISTSATCYTLKATGNTPPTVYAGEDITIPKATPFWLNGQASDADGDVLTYTWEQYDAATTSDMGALGTIVGAGGYDAVHSQTAPLFRSEKSSSPDRTFPKLKFVLNDRNVPDNLEGEALPEVARKMKFRFTAKDGRAGIDMGELTVSVSEAGPLRLTYPNGGENVIANTQQQIKWDVNSTNTLSERVSVLLSVDGGFSFPYVLAENIPNNGECTVTIPTVVQTTKARVKVVAILSPNAHFFDISDADFTLESDCKAYASEPCMPDALSLEVGSEELDLQLAAGSPNDIINSFDLQISDVLRALYVYENQNLQGCYRPLGYDASNLCVFRVSESGQYTLTNDTQGQLIMMLFNSDDISCESFVAANAFHSGGDMFSYKHTMTVYLEKCVNYYFYGMNFQETGDYLISIQGDGHVLEEYATPEGTKYTYIAVDEKDNLIKSVNPGADFRELPKGDYRVYGVSYSESENESDFYNKTLTTVLQYYCALQSNQYVKLNVYDQSGIKDEANDEDIVLYPSPVKNELYIKSDHNILSAEIYSLSGQKLFSQQNISDGKIDIQNLIPGVYIIKLIDDSEHEYTMRIVKE
ncbi:zinc-dependent metalloprotease [Dysgonomonas sp. 520]|uniref:zinc-dependent metalloprotease n=1 Tax=Dysgonomonas sp. 520 TaxID=2302931 RepID=UPI0013D0F96E|nr:zinc-dependent metalloprotease [Dysgonomonas sp. 520]NDW10223.1 T9SS C-terminal target domain-containing protein [Dysgonomonas sp. 520]